ncbi:hypothetical protein Lesp02_42960 [Lentzea sp. NBRC 105346]|uniref:hypothetical protein n=1 Tax=Lentzea sp. NBRC 105346 TaxID=3032205 RepID=UPI0024A335E6|nr:hypothetical protein [Lentzea sp. NBRC 105346]GLZ32108.1 hypothetical protein Lesp02_42960 [Lentzea sp. NBRC 105346]
MLADWLLTAVAKTVTTYTQPGQRVLLLHPAPYLTSSVTSARSQPQLSLCAGLHEAGWTVVRLGRGVQTHTPIAPSAEQRDVGLVESESGPDRYELVLAAADPTALDWFRPSGWADMLTPAGTLAVITRGVRSGGRFIDPAERLVHAAHEAGLRYLDRIALLHVPLREVLHTPPASARHRQVHDDLLVFGRSVSPACIAESGGASR